MQVVLSPRVSARLWFLASQVEARENALDRGDAISLLAPISFRIPTASSLLDSAAALPEGFSTSYSAAALGRFLEECGLGSHANVSVFRPGERRRALGENVLLPPALRGLSFACLEEGVYVCPPELCLLTAANSLSAAHYLLLAYEYCGKYVLDRGIGRGMGSRPPLTSSAALTDFLEVASGMRGTRSLRWALKWLADGSESPRESCLAAMFAMPKVRNGYGFGAMSLNKKILLSRKASEVNGRSSCRVDLLVPGTKLVFEYDSDAEHSLGANQRKDTRRETALSMDGYEVHSVTNSQVKSIVQMDGLARIVADRVGAPTSFLDREQKGRAELLRSLTNRHSWRTY